MTSYLSSKNISKVRAMAIVAVALTIAGGVTEGSGQAVYGGSRGPNSVTPNQGGSLAFAPAAAPNTLPRSYNYFGDDASNDILNKYKSDPRKSGTDSQTSAHGSRLKLEEKKEDEKQGEQAELTNETLGGHPIYRLKDGTEFVQANDNKDLIRVKPPGKPWEQSYLIHKDLYGVTQTEAGGFSFRQPNYGNGPRPIGAVQLQGTNTFRPIYQNPNGTTGFFNSNNEWVENTGTYNPFGTNEYGAKGIPEGYSNNGGRLQGNGGSTSMASGGGDSRGSSGGTSSGSGGSSSSAGSQSGSSSSPSKTGGSSSSRNSGETSIIPSSETRLNTFPSEVRAAYDQMLKNSSLDNKKNFLKSGNWGNRNADFRANIANSLASTWYFRSVLIPTTRFPSLVHGTSDLPR